ncbi:hypothetical protein AURDEDRAFT_171979 [Auricularia subglabra TFB-10046 SS5]|nr:hypothetical protein AURDEDRAFT_171979 [Auricularia subglabra TFB-10046 SS5]
MSTVIPSSTDTKPGANAPSAEKTPQATTPDAIRLFLATPGAPDVYDLAKFRAMGEVQSGFDEMQRNLKGSPAHAPTFDKYKEGWNAICNLLEEVRTLRLRTVELEAENDIIIDLVKEVADLKCEVTRLEEENKSLAQDNVQMRDNLNSKLSAIDSWIRMERARARAEALDNNANTDSIEGAQNGLDEAVSGMHL